jgi:hypothetical protein
MGTKAWVKASSSGRRFPPEVHPGAIEWFDEEMGKGEVDVLVAMTRWIVNFTAVPCLPEVKAPVLGLYPSEGPVVDTDQIDILRKGLRSFALVRVPTRYHAIASFEPATCATQVLHFAAQHDGIVCREA